MKTLALALWILCSAVTAFAQASSALQPPPPTQADLENQMVEVGCKAERSAAAQTIVNLQKQITQLQDQLKKTDPPKSGATKH